MKQHTTKGKNQKSEITCFYCKKTGHIARNCQKRLNSEKQNVINMSAFCGSTIKCKDTWIIDSGATHHMAPKEEYFSTIDKSSHIEGIALADGRKASSMGKGAVSAVIKSDNSGSVVKFKTENTLLVPDIKCGILSVKQLIENDREVLFNEKGCFIYDKTGNLLMEAKEKDRLYVMHTEPMKESEVGLNSMVRKETKSESLDLWHRRMMHVSKHKILEMANANSVIGLNCKKSSPTPCDSCLAGKSTRQPFPKKPTDSVDKRTKILELVHSDLMGPIDVPSWGHKKYMLSIIDDASRYVFVRFLDNKSAALNEFKKWKTEIEKQTGKCLKRIRTDNGLEFCSKNWTAFCKSTGIRHETTMTYTPQQNGIAERFNRTVLDLVRSQIQESNFPKKSWAELIFTATYIRNRVTNTHDNQKTPYELWTGKKPSVRHLRAIGCEVFVHIPKQKRFSKLSKRAESGILIGYAVYGRGYRVWMPATQQVVESRDCVFKEFSSEEPLPTKDNVHESAEIQHFCDSTPNEYKDDVNADSDPEPSQENEDAPIPERKCRGRPKKDATKQKPEAVREHKMTLRSSEMSIQNVDANILTTQKEEPDEPLTYRDAMISNESAQWLEAMTEEMESLAAHNSWDLEELPPGVTPVKCKWIYKRKTMADKKGFKARLVAKGYSQRKGMDYEDVYAPVSSFETMRLLVAASVEKDWYIDQYDIKSAYLHSNLKETIYMEQPEGFVQGKGNLVCKLKKSLYGLKQSGRCWNDHLNESLKSMGFIRNETDPCVYQLNTNDCRAIIIVYVDDMLVMTENKAAKNKVKALLSSGLEVKYIGKVSQMLGVKFERETSGCITLSQKDYIDKLLTQFGLEDAKGAKTPMEAKPCLDEDKELEDTPYRELIGGLLYLSLRTRPDITFAVTKLAQYSSNYNRSHWNSAKRILRYLKDTRDYKLSYRPTGQKLSAFADADWATSNEDRKSTSGYIVMLAGSPVTWKSAK